MTAFTTRPELTGHFGMVSSTHWLASQTGQRMLELGGNAFDAAVAAGLVLQVAEPHLNGPLGEVPILLFDAQEGKPRVLCGQGPAPQAATIDQFEALGLDSVPGNGLLPAVVPGAFDAWMLLLRDYGNLPLFEVMAPVIHYAAQGVPVTSRLQASIAQLGPWFSKHWPENAAIYLPGGSVPDQGVFLKNPALAQMYARILQEAEGAGPDRMATIEAARAAFRTGFVAEAIAAFCAAETSIDISGRHHSALLTGEDIANWQAHYEDPVTATFGTRTVCKTGPWGQGPVLLIALKMCEKLLDRLKHPNDAEFYHTVIEVMKLAYADRDTFFGDPDAIDVPLGVLLSDDYITARAGLVGVRADLTWRPGAIPGYGYAVDYHAATNRDFDPEALAASGLGEPTSKERGAAATGLGDTCHVTACDRFGNMVAATPSGGWMEASPVIPALGVCLGTRLQMTSLDRASPDALAPGRRPRTTLSPTLILGQEGRAEMALGTPGGDKQDQWQLAFLLRHLICGQSMQEAIDEPGFSATHWPNSFYPRHAEPGAMRLEGRAGATVLAELAARGHRVTTADDWSEGWICATAYRDGGVLSAAASPRGAQAYATGR